MVNIAPAKTGGLDLASDETAAAAILMLAWGEVREGAFAGSSARIMTAGHPLSTSFLMHCLCENLKACYLGRMSGNETTACAGQSREEGAKKDFLPRGVPITH
jgi:hypothetical protein